MIRDRKYWWARGLFASVVLLVGVLGTGVCGHTAELGHYAPALPTLRSFAMPEPGFSAQVTSLYYSSETLKDRNGDKVNAIRIGNQRIRVDTDVDSYLVVPTFAYVTTWKVLGAKYGFLVAPYFGNTSFQSALELESNPEFRRGIDESDFSVADLYFRPVWLGWALPRADIMAAYSLYAPTGKFDVNSTANVGLGMWTHELQVGGLYYFDAAKGTALSLATTYEIHENKEDVDITPGSHLSLNYGLSQYLPVSETWVGEVGIAGIGQWQVTKDSGKDTFNKEVKDQVLGLGPELSLIYLPWRAQLNFRWIHEFDAKARFEGNFFNLTLAAAF